MFNDKFLARNKTNRNLDREDEWTKTVHRSIRGIKRRRSRKINSIFQARNPMPFITIKCPVCHKIAETEETYKIAGKLVNRLKCGHLLNSDQINHSSPEQIRSLDNKALYQFQNDGVRFIEESNARCLISDEMGLGKTPQSISAILLHPELQP